MHSMSITPLERLDRVLRVCRIPTWDARAQLQGARRAVYHGARPRLCVRARAEPLDLDFLEEFDCSPLDRP
eukprot:512496-Prymnesium_polylepis.1